MRRLDDDIFGAVANAHTPALDRVLPKLSRAANHSALWIAAGAGLAAFAIGTETWGSIICPSGFCGLSGLRPTYGRVSRYGAMALSYTMDKIGPITRSAGDCDLVLKVISGHDPQDLGSLPEASARYAGAEPVNGKLRVGWLVNQWKEISPEVNQASMAARQVLEKSPSVAMSNV